MLWFNYFQQPTIHEIAKEHKANDQKKDNCRFHSYKKNFEASDTKPPLGGWGLITYHLLCILHRRGCWFFSTEHFGNSCYPFIFIQQPDICFHLAFYDLLEHEEMSICFTGNLRLMCNTNHLAITCKLFHDNSNLSGSLTRNSGINFIKYQCRHIQLLCH